MAESSNDFLAHASAYLETIEAHMTALRRMFDDKLMKEETFNEEMAHWAGMKELIEQVIQGLHEL